MGTPDINLTRRFFIAAAALSGAAGVAMGAYASHGLQQSLGNASLAVIQTALDYQFIHTLLLLFISLVPVNSRYLTVAGSFFILGILFFSVNLYAVQLLPFTSLSRLTPLGGLLFILGWLTLFLFALTHRHAKKNTDY